MGGFGEVSINCNENWEAASINCCTVCTIRLLLRARAKGKKESGKNCIQTKSSSKCINNNRFWTRRKETRYTTISLFVQEFIMASNTNKSGKLHLIMSEYFNDLRYKYDEIRKWRHRFFRGFNETKQECLTQKATKYKHAVLHVV